MVWCITALWTWLLKHFILLLDTWLTNLTMPPECFSICRCCDKHLVFWIPLAYVNILAVIFINCCLGNNFNLFFLQSLRRESVRYFLFRRCNWVRKKNCKLQKSMGIRIMHWQACWKLWRRWKSLVLTKNCHSIKSS